jgi:DNA-binding beta-propeller fold protein YncE
MNQTLLSPARLLLLPVALSLVGIGCEPPVDEDAPIFGDGSHTLGSVELTVVADSDDDLDVPRDIAFHPDEPTELWILNRGSLTFDESVVVIDDPGTGDRESTLYQSDGNHHFMAQGSALAFSDNGNFATIHETDERTQGPNGTAGDFMGPTLWTSDRDIFDAGHDGHLDMLHNSPDGMGIAWEDDNIFWVFDGDHASITRYDFNGDHGPGGSDHSDGQLLRYVEGDVKRESDVPSHMEYDAASELLYIADTGNGRIAVLDTTTGEEGDRVGPNNDGTDQFAMDDADMDTLVDADDIDDMREPSGLAIHEGVLYVGDNRTGFLFAFDLDGELLDWVDLEIDRGGLMGLAFNEDGTLFLVDAEAEEIFRLDNVEVE